MTFMDKATPTLTEQFVPPTVLGLADLATFAYHGGDLPAMMRRIEAATSRNLGDMAEAASIFDMSIAAQLAGRRDDGLAYQLQALRQMRIFRVGEGYSREAVRVLAIMAPGDLMVNTPVDFLTGGADVRLDLLYLIPGEPLPAVLPDHDVAFFAISETDPSLLARLRWLHATWPRPAINNPRWLPALGRDALAQALAGVAVIKAPDCVAASRHDIETDAFQPWFCSGPVPWPLLVRPRGSHAGAELERVETPDQLLTYIHASSHDEFFLTAFEPYCGGDGLYRKYRIAFVDRQPYLCHMAVSRHWMVHYLNAGMADSAERRAEEELAMRTFDETFARRHAAAFDALHKRIGFDYYSIDCAEAQDGRLLVFETDTAAIVHRMDPPDLFPYKVPAMHKVCDAFNALLRRRARGA